MALYTAKIKVVVSYNSDLREVPSDEDLLEAYQSLRDAVEDDSTLQEGFAKISFEIGDESGGDA